jgi:hypothetical protein
MNPQDYAAWSHICRYAAHAPCHEKDSQAETLLKVVAAYRPDVPYVLAQYAIQLEQALFDAEEEIKLLQQKIVGACAGGVKESRHRQADGVRAPQNVLRIKPAASSKSN